MPIFENILELLEEMSGTELEQARSCFEMLRLPRELLVCEILLADALRNLR